MSAVVYPAAAWMQARYHRASVGKAPRLSVTRMMLLRQIDDERWTVAVHVKRHGIWGKPQWLTGPVPYPQARCVVADAWRQCPLPIGWAYRGEKRMRPFYFDHSEPVAVRS
jgi:hypothetical protein